jgi:hypothetical protein
LPFTVLRSGSSAAKNFVTRWRRVWEPRNKEYLVRDSAPRLDLCFRRPWLRSRSGTLPGWRARTHSLRGQVACRASAVFPGNAPHNTSHKQMNLRRKAASSSLRYNRVGFPRVFRPFLRTPVNVAAIEAYSMTGAQAAGFSGREADSSAASAVKALQAEGRHAEARERYAELVGRHQRRGIAHRVSLHARCR